MKPHEQAPQAKSERRQALTEQEKPSLEEVLFPPNAPCSAGPEGDLAAMISALWRDAQVRATQSGKAPPSDPQQSRTSRPEGPR
jgi:hypothetical protein